MTRSLTLVALALAGCAAPVEMSFDEDVDGLLTIDEIEIYGTDPLNPDTDGDGHLDGAEVLAGTDPLDPTDHPYHADWRIDGECRAGIVGTGTNVGDIAEPFRLPSQYGDNVRLNDFCNQVVMLKLSAGWCGACRATESQHSALYDQFKDRGFMSITLLFEPDARGQEVDREFLEGWADQYGASHAVVADNERHGSRYERDGGIPSYILIKPGMELVMVDEGMPTAEQIEALLPE